MLYYSLKVIFIAKYVSRMVFEGGIAHENSGATPT